LRGHQAAVFPAVASGIQTVVLRVAEGVHTVMLRVWWWILRLRLAAPRRMTIGGFVVSTD